MSSGDGARVTVPERTEAGADAGQSAPSRTHCFADTVSGAGFNPPPIDQFADFTAWAAGRGAMLPADFYGRIPTDLRRDAFTVSGLAAIDQVQAVQDTLTDAVERGGTFAQWKREALQVPGFGGLADYRRETIFRTHLQSAYSAGRWEQFSRGAAHRPYLMYDAINDSRTRPTHRALDNTIRPVGDEFWATHTPPLGFSCRCALISMSEAQARARGGATPFPDPAGRADGPGFGLRPDIDRGESLLAAIRARTAQCGGAGSARRMWCAPGPIREMLQRLGDGLSADAEQIVTRQLGDTAGPELLAEAMRAVADRPSIAGLPASRAATIWLWTRDQSDGALFKRIGATLRGERGADSIGRMAPMIAVLQDALKSIPVAAEPVIFRGVARSARRGDAFMARFEAAHQERALVQYNSFTAATLDPAIARKFAGKTGWVLEIEHLTGRNIAPWSYYDAIEAEILIPMPSRYRVIFIDPDKRTIQMQELPENDTTDLARVQQFSLRDTLSPQSRAAFDEADRKLREYDRLEQEGKIPPPTEAQRAIMRHMQYG